MTAPTQIVKFTAKFSLVLDGLDCDCVVERNARDDDYFLTISNARGDLITSGRIVASPDYANIPLCLLSEDVLIYRASTQTFEVNNLNLKPNPYLTRNDNRPAPIGSTTQWINCPTGDNLIAAPTGEGYIST